MKTTQLNIAFISNNKDAIPLRLFLKDPQINIFDINFKDASIHSLKTNIFDLVIFDFTASNPLDLKQIGLLRKEKHLSNIPFLYILGERQYEYRAEIFKDERSAFLKHTFDKYDLLSVINYLTTIRDLERRIFLYNDILKSEKQIIYYLDELLQLNAFSKIKSAPEFFSYLENQFVHRLELTLGIESAIFLEYVPQQDSFLLKHYDRKNNSILKKSLFNIKNSEIKRSLVDNTPIMFENNKLSDSFIADIEAAIGFKIETLLFAPFYVLHKLYGGIALINKAYRNTFTDNDITLLVLTIQKLAYQLETVFLKELRLDNFENIIRKDTQRGDIKYEYRLYKDILQSIEFGLMVFDQNFIILYLNKFAQNILEIESVKNLSLLDALGTEAFRTVERLIKQNKIPALRQEMLITKLPNLSLYLGFSIYQLFSSAESKQFALTFMEISQRKRAQAEIQRMDRMISLGVLASGIAHEIRNPLAGIKAMAQTLEEEMKNDHVKIEYVKRIIRQVNRLDVLLRSFFSYAKPLRPNPVVCNISDIVHEVLPFFDQKIKEKNIRIKEKYEHDLSPIYVDFNQIQQVIFNLIINSIDAMENGGILSIIARKPEGTRTLIDRRQSMPKVFSEEFCELSIKDTGTGIDSENINHIYNPFFTTKTNGIGLGLSVVYQIIREHRGQITVTSELGKGTTFTILLPSYARK